MTTSGHTSSRPEPRKERAPGLVRSLPLRAFVRFCAVALVLGIVGAGVLYAMVEYAGIHYLAAGAINCLVMTLLTYHANSVFTYGYYASTRGFIRFLASRLSSIVLGTSL